MVTCEATAHGIGQSSLTLTRRVYIMFTCPTKRDRMIIFLGRLHQTVIVDHHHAHALHKKEKEKKKEKKKKATGWLRVLRVQELRGSRGGPPGLPVPNIPYGLCGRKSNIER